MTKSNKDGEQWLLSLPSSDRVLLKTNLPLVEIWQRMTEQGREVVRAMVRAGKEELTAHQRKLDEWMIANYVRLKDGRLERKPRAKKEKPRKRTVFDDLEE